MANKALLLLFIIIIFIIVVVVVVIFTVNELTWYQGEILLTKHLGILKQFVKTKIYELQVQARPTSLRHAKQSFQERSSKIHVLVKWI
jgi:hypothetical protein